MTATSTRTSSRSTPMLFSRQRQLLQLLDVAIGDLSAAHDADPERLSHGHADGAGW